MSTLLPISELLSYRMHRVANAISRSAATRYRRDFDVSLGEWRTLALLGEDSTLTLNRLAARAGLDKGADEQGGGKLDERGLLVRESGAGRSTRLSLSRKGKSVYQGLIEAANERNDAFLVCLSAAEREALDSALDKLGKLAKALESQESL